MLVDERRKVEGSCRSRGADLKIRPACNCEPAVSRAVNVTPPIDTVLPAAIVPSFRVWVRLDAPTWPFASSARAFAEAIRLLMPETAVSAALIV